MSRFLNNTMCMGIIDAYEWWNGSCLVQNLFNYTRLQHWRCYKDKQSWKAPRKEDNT
jgi:hypothetical protein